MIPKPVVFAQHCAISSTQNTKLQIRGRLEYGIKKRHEGFVIARKYLIISHSIPCVERGFLKNTAAADEAKMF